MLKLCWIFGKAYLALQALLSRWHRPRQKPFRKNWRGGLEIATLHADIRFSHAADGCWRAGKRAVLSVDDMEVAL